MGKKIAIIAGVIVAAVYMGFSIFFMGHFQFRTQINDINASMKSVEGLQKLIEKESDGYILTINGRGNVSDTIAASEIDLKPQFDESYKKILDSQNAFLWPGSVFKDTAISSNTVVAFSEDKLKSRVRSLKFLNKANETAPKDASLSDYSEGGYKIIPADEGTTVDEAKLTNAAEDAVATLMPELDLDKAAVYVEPAVKTDDASLNQLAGNLNKIVNSKITFTFGDNVETLDGSTIKDWISVSDNNAVSVNSASAREYVNSLAKKYDTFGLPRQFHTTGGDTITVSGGAYGWWTDRPATTAALVDAISNGKSGKLDIVYRAVAAQYGDNDIGNSYVEINIGAQHLYVYKDGQMAFQSDFVSGGLMKGNNTPDGTYAITYKERDATLVGENYESAVSYWMPFNGNIGMHDAPWRDSFGGHIYYMKGSHGCINLPEESAKTIFSLVEKGEAVVVYGGITKEEAINSMTDAEKLTAITKGYIPMTPDMAAALQAQVSANAAPDKH